LLHEILCQFDIVKVGPSVHNDSPDNTANYLRGVSLFVLHRERVAEDLEDGDHRAIEVATLAKEGEEEGAVSRYVRAELPKIMGWMAHILAFGLLNHFDVGSIAFCGVPHFFLPT
jgi:hypothetical protein